MAETQKKIHWREIKIQVNSELAEALAEVLGRFVSGGVVVQAVTRFNSHTQENEPTGEVLISGYLLVDEKLAANQQKIEEALWHLSQIEPIPRPQYADIQDQDWMKAWKEHYSPIEIGEKMLVMPAWQELQAGESRSVIRINPAMAFGTGTHPTTQLCMRLMEKHLTQGTRVIDIGCGSGILSIAALKLGAKNVIAVDVDGQAIDSTKENAILNGISSTTLEIGKGSVKEILSGQFSYDHASLVMVNILASIILRLFEQGLADIVTKDGMLLLSGILIHQEEEIMDTAQQKGFKLVSRLSDGDWVSVALRKKSD